MAKAFYAGANVNSTTGTFATWLERTNQIVYDMSDVVVTVADVTSANSTNGSQTTGNGHIQGYLSANVLIATEELRGGRNAEFGNSATLLISSNVAIGNTGGSETLFVAGNSTLEGTLEVDGVVTFNANLALSDTSISGELSFVDTTQSTSSSTGAAKFAGGVGIAKDLFIAGNTDITGNLSADVSVAANVLIATEELRGGVFGNSATLLVSSNVAIGNTGGSETFFVAGNSTLEGSLEVDGVVTFNANLAFSNSTTTHISGDTTFTSAMSITDSTQATNTNTGALTVDGGAGFIKDVFIGGDTDITGDVIVRGDATFASIMTITDTTQATNTNTGALTVDGGVGIAKDVFIAGNTDILGDTIVRGNFDVEGVFNLPSNTNLTVNDTQTLTFTVTSLATINGNTVLGNAGTDSVTFNARIESNILPITANTYDLGSSSLKWNDLYVSNAEITYANISAEVNAPIIDTSIRVQSPLYYVEDQGDIRFYEDNVNGLNYLAFQAPASVASNVTWTLPSVDAAVSGYALVSDGSGTLSWGPAGAITTADTTTNTDFYIHFDNTTSGAVTAVKHDTGLRYNPSTGTLTVDVVTGQAGTVAALTGLDTGDLTEGSGLYYTTTRANTAIDARVTKTFVDALNVDADTFDSLNSTQFIRSDAADVVSANTNWTDNSRLLIGTSSDLQIYHNATDSYIVDNGTGNLKIAASQIDLLGGADAAETMATFVDNGAVTLYYDNSAKIATASGGVTITGTATATTFSGSGSGLTALNASNISTGTLVSARLSGTYAISISGNAATATSATSATSATNATNFAVTNNTTENGNLYPVFVDGTSGNQGGEVASTKLTFNPSTGTLTATAFSGDGSSLTNVDATTVDGVNSTSFLRSDAADTKTSGNLTLNDNIALNLGTGLDAELYFDATQLNLDMNSDADFLIRDGNSANATRFTFDTSSGNFTAVGEVISSSDARLKEDLEVIPDALDKVKQLSGYTYRRIDLNNVTQAGVIAQEVEKVLPEVVVEDGDGYKSVAYGNMVALLIEAIKEQQKQIDELRGKSHDH
jgi:hypothetical protein